MGWLVAIGRVLRYAPAIIEAVKIVLQRHPELVPDNLKPTATKMIVNVEK